ncbi:hypothetical protein CU097_007004 [Rhizopus azygosporus]|uniref:Uncharacterized protein n=1 Tax=Rhizopus azygosporus TaxID=86630 RepID=A0A367J1U0_RHIAZ|nr:hypothetical protein CU097_007004 [Rhizopus azygosporus]
MEKVWYFVFGERDFHTLTSLFFVGLTPSTRNKKGFACPIYLKNNKTTRSFTAHLKNHGLGASFVKKRKLDKLDSVYEHCVDKEETDEDIDQHLAGGEVVHDETTCENGFTQLPPSSLLLAVQPTTKLPHLTHRDVILTTTDSHAADKATQEDKMMLAKLGRWVPVIYNHDNMQHGMLTSSSVASILLSKNQTKGT